MGVPQTKSSFNIRAAAKTHMKTGLPIQSHTGPEKPALAQLEILKEEGVAPDAFIWVHAQRGTREAHIQLANQGVWVSFDKMKNAPDITEQFVGFLRIYPTILPYNSISLYR